MIKAYKEKTKSHIQGLLEEHKEQLGYVQVIKDLIHIVDGYPTKDIVDGALTREVDSRHSLKVKYDWWDSLLFVELYNADNECLFETVIENVQEVIDADKCVYELNKEVKEYSKDIETLLAASRTDYTYKIKERINLKKTVKDVRRFNMSLEWWLEGVLSYDRN